jgi:hypothetical protein
VSQSSLPPFKKTRAGDAPIGTGELGSLGSVRGCVGIPTNKDDVGRMTVLVWPQGARVTHDANGLKIQIGNEVLRVGDHVLVDPLGPVDLSKVAMPSRCRKGTRGLYVRAIERFPEPATSAPISSAGVEQAPVNHRGGTESEASRAPLILVDNGGSGQVSSDLRGWHGELVLSADGCVAYATPSGDEQVLVWPAGSQVTGSGDDAVIQSQGERFRIGDEVIFDKSFSSHPVPEGCDGDKVFVHEIDHDEAKAK